MKPRKITGYPRKDDRTEILFSPSMKQFPLMEKNKT